MSVVGLVLAGGSGSRLGTVRKWQLRFGGDLLIARIAAQLRDSTEQVLISARPDEAALGAYGTPVRDLDLPLGGPLAGLVAAMEHLGPAAGKDTIILSVAVDTPFLPANYASRMLSAMAQDQAGAEAGWRGNGYPTHAAWRFSARRDLRARLVDGTGISSPRALLKTLNAPLVDWSDEAKEDPFANINTLADVVALARRGQRTVP